MCKLFRDQAAFLRAENKKLTSDFLPVDPNSAANPHPGLIAVWRSSRFLVQLFEELNGAQRISINRTMVDITTGRWVDGITWEEIQTIKKKVGFGDRTAVEIYPPDSNVVNVANMRHIWLVPDLPFAWCKL